MSNSAPPYLQNPIAALVTRKFIDERTAPRLILLVEQGVALLVLFTIMMFNYVFFFQVPYIGFDLANNQVVKVLTPGDLQVGDELLQVGPISLAAFHANLRLPLIEEVLLGTSVPVTFRRGDEILTIQWVIPGRTEAELLFRLNSQWWLAYIFWVAGVMALLVARPINTLRWLLTAFCFLTALWLTMGSVSRYHLWEAAVLLRMVVWITVPVYLHLHWTFPKPLWPVGWQVWAGLYVLGCVLGVMEGFQLLPVNLYAFGLLTAIVGAISLLLAHYGFQADQRRLAGPVIVICAAAIFPIGLLSVLATLFNIAVPTLLLTLLTLPVLPFAYLYGAYRYQLGELEIRANRLVSIYLFVILLLIPLVGSIIVTNRWLDFSGASVLIPLVTGIACAFTAIFGFNRFQKFIERRLLGVRLPPQEMVASYASRITISLDQSTLSNLIKDEVISSLLIRESALVMIEGQTVLVLYSTGIDSEQLPSAAEIALLADNADLLTKNLATDLPGHLKWIKSCLPLSINHKLVGLWLLGRHDPDDYYSQAELSILRSLADQTVIALTNIMQADRLRALYQNDIDQREVERSSIARELHDTALHELKLLKDDVVLRGFTPDMLERYERLVTSLRQTISGLRPAMLRFGLQPALEGLVDNLYDRADAELEIQLDIPKTNELVVHEEWLVLHIYRIIQQVCENSVRHAQAKTLRIYGQITTEKIELMVEDDGIGFEINEGLDVAQLVQHQHFGIAGLFERAAIIKAEIRLISSVGHGTHMRLVWKPA